jgi:hypothetical protein
MKKENEGNKNYFPELLKAISVFISSVIIGGVALFMNHGYNERQSKQSTRMQENQHRLAKIEALVKFMPHLSGSEEQQTSALFAINTIGYPDLALRLSELKKNRTASNTLMREATATIVPTKKESVQPVKAEKELGWIYIGDFSGVTKKWNTRYLDFNRNAGPSSLKEQTYKVRTETGALNLREAMPNENAEFAQIKRALQPGTEVKILEIRPWSTTGYNWARVAGVKE